MLRYENELTIPPQPLAGGFVGYQGTASQVAEKASSRVILSGRRGDKDLLFID